MPDGGPSPGGQSRDSQYPFQPRTPGACHALADEAGDVAGDVEPQIKAAIGPPDLFVDDVLRFAEAEAARVRADH
jgi:hypothetical protein